MTADIFSDTPVIEPPQLADEHKNPGALPERNTSVAKNILFPRTYRYVNVCNMARRQIVACFSQVRTSLRKTN